MKRTVLILLVFFVLAGGNAGVAVGEASADDADALGRLREEVRMLRQEYEGRIERLERQIEILREKVGPVAAGEKPVKGSLTMEYLGRYDGLFGKGGVIIKGGGSSVSLGGYADIEFEDFRDSASSFDQHRWIINIGAELNQRMRFYSEYEIERGGPDSAGGGGEAKVEQAWMDYLISDAINLRAGAILVPMGRYNLYHDSDLQDLTDRPIVDRDIIPTTWTESGAGIYGMFNPRFGGYSDLELNYELYAINGLNSGFSDTGMGGARGSLGLDNNGSRAVVARLLLSPYLGQEVGLSGYWGRYNGSGDAIRGGAVDWLSRWGAFELVGEYVGFSLDSPAGSDIADSFSGYYAQVNYHFWPEFLSNTFLGRRFSNPILTLVGRYGRVKIDDDADVGRGDNIEDRITLGLNYRPVESWVFKLEYQWNKSKNEALERGDNDGFIASLAMGF